jgi:hypothetical protein
MYTKFLILLILLLITACGSLTKDYITLIKTDVDKIYNHVNEKKCFSEDNPCIAGKFIFYSTGNIVLITPSGEQIIVFEKQLIQFSRKFPEHETFFYTSTNILNSDNYVLLLYRNREIEKAINSLAIIL